MAMTGGPVTVADDETHAGSGLALALYLAKMVAGAAQLEPLSEASTRANMPAGLTAEQEAERLSLAATSRLSILRGWASEANALGPALVDYLKAHAEVSLSGVVATVATEASVGRVPDPAAAGAPIDGPATPVTLPVTKGGATRLGLV